jgi:type IV pilus assembly protein PilA
MIQSMKKRLKNQKGLTLIELLAVIVILGIVAAIAVPSIGGLINKSEKDAEVAEAIQIISAAKLHVASSAPSASQTELTSTQLGSYLDNVKTANSSYKVIVKNTGNTFTYELKDHSAVTLADGSDTDDATLGKTATEAELLAY